MHQFKFPEEQQEQEKSPSMLRETTAICRQALGLQFMVKSSEQLKAWDVIMSIMVITIKAAVFSSSSQKTQQASLSLSLIRG